MQENKQPSMLDDMRNGFNMLLFAAFVLAVPTQLFMRKLGTLGSRYITLHFPVCIVLLLLFGLQPFNVLAVLCVVWIVLHKAKQQKGFHSQYVGDSLCGSSRHAKTALEPLAMFIIAAMVFPVSKELTVFLVVSGIASSFFHSWMQDRDNARVRAMHDAELEQRYYMGLRNG